MTTRDVTELHDRLAELADEAKPTAGYPEVRQRIAGIHRRRAVATVVTSVGVVVVLGAGLGIGVLRDRPASPIAGATGTSTSDHPSSSGTTVKTLSAIRLANCPATPLPLPPGVPAAVVNGADPTGRYIVGASDDQTSDGRTSLHAILWDRDTPQVIPVSGADVSAVAVNSAGVVAGHGIRVGTAAGTFAWTFRAGVLTDLNPPAGYASAAAQAINSRGDIVGLATNTKSDYVPVLWPAGALGAPQVLAAPGSSYATGIADDGTVVGKLVGDRTGGYVWDAQRHGRLLPDPAGLTGGGVSAVNGDWAVGFANLGTGGGPSNGASSNGGPSDTGPSDTGPSNAGLAGGLTSNAVRWNLRTGAADRYPDIGGFGQVNVAGVAVIDGQGRADDGQQRPPQLAVDGRTITLPVAPAGFVLAIDDSNSAAVGYAFSSAAKYAGSTPVRWSC